MTALRAGLTIGSVVTSGLVAGLFCAFAYSVMPGLTRADSRSAVVAMQRINVAIVNPVFLVLFFGGLMLCSATWFVHRGDRIGVWALVAAVCYLAGVVVTMVANVPLNDRLAAVGDPRTTAGYDQAWSAFGTAWVRWNVVRAALHTAGFLTLATALVVRRTP